jgi:hypothetical protein
MLAHLRVVHGKPDGDRHQRIEEAQAQVVRTPSHNTPTRNAALKMLLVTLNRILAQSPVPVNDCRFAKVGRTKAQIFISAHDDGTQHPLFCFATA